MNGWVEIFRTGTHTDSRGRKMKWTERDLDRIVSTYDPKKREAPIVVGHPKSNAPAWGWVARLRRTGQVLEARFRQVAPAFLKAVRAGRYKKRSISLYPDKTLRHVGWLGGVPPAVEGMADVAFKGKRKHQTYEFQEVGMKKNKKLKRELKASRRQVKELETQVRSFSAHLSPSATKKRAKKRVKKVKNLVKDGKVTPAMSERILAFATALGVSREKIALAGSDAVTVEEHFWDMLEGQPELSIFHVLDDAETITPTPKKGGSCRFWGWDLGVYSEGPGRTGQSFSSVRREKWICARSIFDFPRSE